MINEIETEKSLSQLKRFIVREMKNQSADWVKTKIQPSYGPDQKGFKSEYLKINPIFKSLELLLLPSSVCLPIPPPD